MSPFSLFRTILFMVICSGFVYFSFSQKIHHFPLIKKHPKHNPGAHSSRGVPKVFHIYIPDEDVDLSDFLDHSTSHSSSFTKTATGKFVQAPVFGGLTTVGEFFTPVLIGQQLFHVQIDTGSSTLAVPSINCMSCFPYDHRYDPKVSDPQFQHNILCNSTMCRPNVCQAMSCPSCSSTGACCAPDEKASCMFYLHYGDGSGALGYLTMDQFYLSEKLSAVVPFGAVLAESPNFERQFVDGIWGLAYAGLSCTPTCIESPMDAFWRLGYLAENVFSICLDPIQGLLSMGGYNPNLIRKGIQYASVVQTKPAKYYLVELENRVLIGGKETVLPRFNTAIVDSGTTLITLSNSTFEALRDQIMEHNCDVPGLCGEDTWFQPASCAALAPRHLEILPTITLRVAPLVQLELTAKDYMIPFQSGKRTFHCLGFMILDLSNGIDVILGNVVQMKYITIYDKEKSRIGFAERTGKCSPTAGCASLSDCDECILAPYDCAYDYKARACVTSKRSFISTFFPYPKCTGAACLCWFEAGALYAVLLVWVGFLTAMMALVAFLVLPRVRRSQYQAIH